jgi:hypothetical protein
LFQTLGPYAQLVEGPPGLTPGLCQDLTHN